MVSHDRFFMDKVVDHLLVFEGDAVIRDYPGNYTRYREDDEWKALQKPEDKIDSRSAESGSRKNGVAESKPVSSSAGKRKPSFKEKKEFESLELEIQELESEKAQVEAQLGSGQLTVDEVTRISQRFAVLNELLDEKSMRWLELSELC